MEEEIFPLALTFTARVHDNHSDDSLELVVLHDKETRYRMKFIEYDSIFMTSFFQLQIFINSKNSFPFSVKYQYESTSMEISKAEHEIRFESRPESNIYLNDDLNNTQLGENMVKLIFNIKCNLNQGSSIALYLTTLSHSFSAFGIKQNRDYYKFSFVVSIDEILTCFYSLALTKGNAIDRLERSRAHTLHIMARSGRKIVMVNDTFTDQNFILPPLLPPTHLDSVPYPKVSANFEFCYHPIPNEVVFSNDTNGEINLVNYNGTWYGGTEINSKESNSTYKIMIKKGFGDILSSHQQVECQFSGLDLPPDAIISRTFVNDPQCKRLGIYVPLISLRLNAHKVIGEYTCLSKLAEWCNKVGIMHMHVPFVFYPPLFLDAVHLDLAAIGIDDSNLVFESVAQIRNAKTQLLFKMFQQVQPKLVQDMKFRQFCTSNKEWLSTLPNNFTLHWIMYLCYSQYLEEYKKILKTGVSLFVDVKGMEDKRMIKMFPYFDGIRITGVEENNVVFDEEKINEIFGDESNRVIRTFFSRNGDQFRISSDYSAETSVTSAMKFFNVNSRVGFQEKIKNAREIAKNQKFLEKNDVKYIWFNTVPKQTGAVISLDQNTSSFISIEQANDLNLVPTASAKRLDSTLFQTRNVMLVPDGMDVFKTTEFQPDCNKEKIMSLLKKRLNSEAIIAIFYLNDLLSLSECETLDYKTNSDNLFIFSTTVEDLCENDSISEKIQAISKRG